MIRVRERLFAAPHFGRSGGGGEQGDFAHVTASAYPAECRLV